MTRIEAIAAMALELRGLSNHVATVAAAQEKEGNLLFDGAKTIRAMYQCVVARTPAGSPERAILREEFLQFKREA